MCSLKTLQCLFRRAGRMSQLAEPMPSCTRPVNVRLGPCKQDRILISFVKHNCTNNMTIMILKFLDIALFFQQQICAYQRAKTLLRNVSVGVAACSPPSTSPGKTSNWLFASNRYAEFLLHWRSSSRSNTRYG
eukprot:TRINITY_DN42055_c0_g1_i1.p2 TRINITY_DN42055_c0_g1~~TRINITY_DN42055_c0_g1_i1.p2  ORF type:complete len:133 (-),score=10.35 TRINITY_DN42055_c0_g1_i1:295-693(-)